MPRHQVLIYLGVFAVCVSHLRIRSLMLGKTSALRLNQHHRSLKKLPGNLLTPKFLTVLTQLFWVSASAETPAVAKIRRLIAAKLETR